MLLVISFLSRASPGPIHSTAQGLQGPIPWQMSNGNQTTNRTATAYNQQPVNNQIMSSNNRPGTAEKMQTRQDIYNNHSSPVMTQGQSIQQQNLEALQRQQQVNAMEHADWL